MITLFKFLPLTLLAACDYGYPFIAALPDAPDVVSQAFPPPADVTPPRVDAAPEVADKPHEAATEASVDANATNASVEAATPPPELQPEAAPADASVEAAGDGCTSVLHHGGNGPSSWWACYPLATFTQTSATDACNAYFREFYQAGEWSPCAPISCPNAALPPAELVCASIRGADGGIASQICWVYSGSLSPQHGPGSSCLDPDPCSGTCVAYAMWQ